MGEGKLCSNACRYIYVAKLRSESKPLKNCLWCNNLFKQIGTKPKFCSPTCSNRHKAANTTVWNKDMKYSQEVRDKMSIRMKKEFKNNNWLLGHRVVRGEEHPNYGKPLPISRRIKMSATKIGISIEEWNGFKADENQQERDRFAVTMRQKVMKRDNFTCQVCQQYGVQMHVDHIKKWSDYPELRFEMDNCRTLCVPCHYYVTFKKKIPSNTAWGQSYTPRSIA